MAYTSNLPYAAEVEAEISAAELEVLEDAYKRAAVTTRGAIPAQIKFNYGWGLVRSRFRENQLKGVQLLQEIFHDDAERRRECAYYLALGYYKLGNYSESRKYNEILLEEEPNNLQALSLQKLTDERVNREGLVGMAVVGGLAAAAGLAISAFIRRNK